MKFAETIIEICSNHQLKYRKFAIESLKRIFTSLRYFACQGLPTRRHIDYESNFNQLLYLRTSDSKDLQIWFQRKTTWTSVEIQEEILAIMADHIVLSFAEEVPNCGVYGLIADETSDISQIEQLSICLRIVDNGLSTKENVFGFYAIEKCDANSLYIAISDALLRLNISLQNCLGVTFHGASAFSGQSTGVGVRITEIAPSAIQTHCHMHCVNLAVQDLVKAILLMRYFLHLANDLIIFLRNSPKRCAIAMQLDCPQTHIRPLCPTRFTVKYSALSGIYQQYDVIIDALEEISTQSCESGIKSKANGYG